MDQSTKAPLILVVDDNPQNLQLIAGMLTDRFDLCFASSGFEALEVVQTLVPDLILLDINMPEMDGFQVCRRLRSSEKTMQVPVVFLTAQEETDYIVEGFRCGGSDYVVKPFQPEVLRARVRVQLALYWARLEMKKMNEKLRRVNAELRLLSSMDGLLLIANRREFDATLEKEWQRAIREGHPISLLIVDVDLFKNYNDYYGHAQGDECLKTIARVLASCVKRPADLLARYGGEELAIILPQTEVTGAMVVAQAIHQSLYQTAIEHEASSVSSQVTVSIGLGCMVPHVGMQSDTLVQAADLALYTAKDKGRNCTSVGQE